MTRDSRARSFNCQGATAARDRARRSSQLTEALRARAPKAQRGDENSTPDAENADRFPVFPPVALRTTARKSAARPVGLIGVLIGATLP